ncbi:MAG: nucleotidyltransferase domain-containing protein [Solirubrobacterales bacterium]
MSGLGDLARELGADERTLRRAAADGMVRCERLGPRRQRVSEQERRYAIGHWELLAKLRGALRTEPNVRLAVVYGSIARGDETPGSDLDLLVSLAKDRPDAAVKLAVRLEHTLGREVDVTRLNRVHDSAPLLLLQALDEGRVILDRDRQWDQLCARRNEIARRARRSHEARRRRARASIHELVCEEP